MTAIAGSDMTLAIGDGATPVESFTMIGGVQLVQLQMQQALQDASALGDDGWRQLIAGGRRFASITLRGVFSGSASETSLQQAALAGIIRSYELTLGNGETLKGAFLVSSYARTGEIGEPVGFDVTLQSAGSVG